MRSRQYKPAQLGPGTSIDDGSASPQLLMFCLLYCDLQTTGRSRGSQVAWSVATCPIEELFLPDLPY